MLGKATVNSENWTTVPRSKKTNKNNNNNSNANKFDNTNDFKAIKSRRLIITPKAQIGDIDSLLLRNQINSLFKDAKLTIVVNTVEKSKTGQKIVLTTSPDNTAEDLLNNKSIWEHLFDPRTVRKDESWFKVVAHGVNIATFDENMQYLQDEIQKFNSNMQLCDVPRWLARDRHNKIKSSVVLTFNDRNMALNALKGAISRADIVTRKYLPPFVQTHNALIVKNLETSIFNAKVKRNAAYVRKTIKPAIMNAQHASQKLLVHTSSSNARIATRIINPMMKIVKWLYR